MSSLINDCPEEKLREIVSSSFSFNEVKRKLGYSSNGGGLNDSFKKRFQELNIDYSHFKGQGWNRNDEKTSFSSAKTKILKTREYKCEYCGISKWMNKKIILQFHHIDGNRDNNDESNLLLLCPNCHSLTDNWCSKNRTSHVSDEDFLKAIKQTKNIRQACLFLDIVPSGGAYKRAKRLLQEEQEQK